MISDLILHSVSALSAAHAVLHLQVELSQEDLKMLLRILMENLGEAGSLEPTAPKQEASVQQATGGPLAGLTETGCLSACVKIFSLSADGSTEINFMFGVVPCCYFPLMCS